MAKTKTSFTKGQGGKPKGCLNKTTVMSKELIASVLRGRESDINEALDKLKKDPHKFIEAISKLLPYVIPKKTDITSDNESLNMIHITFSKK